MRKPKKTRIDQYSESAGNVVLRPPEWTIPGVLLPGEFVAALYRLSREVAGQMAELSSQGDPALWQVQALHDRLFETLERYEGTLAEYGLELPDSRPVSRDDRVDAWGHGFDDDHDELDDPDMTQEQLESVRGLCKEDIARIDSALLSTLLTTNWRKMASAVLRAMAELKDLPSGVPDLYFAERLRIMIDQGHVQCRGKWNRMGYCELRLVSDGHAGDAEGPGS